MSNRLKPIPRNQSEVTQQALNPPYPLANLGKPDSDTVFSKNRAEDYSMKDDKVKDISIGLEDIDNAVLYYFNNFIKPSVIQNGQRIAVPVLYGSPERWKSVQADGFYRDNSGRIMVPLIMFKRANVEKNRNLTNKLDGNKAHLYQVVGTKYNKRNAYDAFDILNNKQPSEQYYITNVPDYITVSYECIIFTDFVEQNNKLVEAVQFASDAYWGDLNRWRFRTTIDTFTTTTLLENSTDRAAKSTFTIKLNGYLIPNTVNKDLATARGKFYTKSQAIFTMETTSDMEKLTTSGKTPPVKTAMGSSTFSDSYNVNITNTTTTDLSNDIAFYLAVSKTVISTPSLTTTTTATFPNSWVVAPSPLPATGLDNFTFFCNGQFIEKSAIVSFVQSGGNSILTINPTELSYSFEISDEIVAIGKFV